LTGGRAELIRNGYEAWNAGDRSFVLGHLAPDVVWITPPDDPDQGVHRGHEGLTRFWDAWRAAVGQLRFEVIDIAEHDDRVLAVVKRSGVGRQSGLEVSDVVCQVFFFDERDVCRLVREFYDRAAAESAAGFPPSSEGPTKT
jgi:ketosteroid isomerase-like protein